MKILEDVILSEFFEDWRLSNNMVPIVEAIMVYIVAEGRCKDGEHVRLVKFSILGEALFVQNNVTVLGNIRSMEVIVVLNVSIVTVVDLSDEQHELFKVDQVEQIVLFEEAHCHKWHLHVSPDSLGKVINVEVKFVEVEIELLVVLDLPL